MVLVDLPWGNKAFSYSHSATYGSYVET
jgi:hypothetical protein